MMGSGWRVRDGNIGQNDVCTEQMADKQPSTRLTARAKMSMFGDSFRPFMHSQTRRAASEASVVATGPMASARRLAVGRVPTWVNNSIGCTVFQSWSFPPPDESPYLPIRHIVGTIIPSPRYNAPRLLAYHPQVGWPARDIKRASAHARAVCRRGLGAFGHG